MGREPAGAADFTEHTEASEIVCDAGFLRLLRAKVRLPDGASATRYVVRHCGAVAIIALTADKKIVLVRQYRYPLGRHSIEIPAGKLDPGEDPLACAKRELREETGYEASRWHAFVDTHTAVGYSDERIRMFVATQARKVGQASPDPSEFVEPLALDLAAAWELMVRGEITENRTLLALMWLRLREREPAALKLAELG